jgi:predicted lysophospholipase L1 biosynthesis ABC-type transport system permease subunit
VSTRGSGAAAVPVRPALVGAIVALAGVVAAMVFAASLYRLTADPTRYGIAWDLATDIPAEQAHEIARRDDIGDLAVLASATVMVEGKDAQGHALDVVTGDASFTVLDGRLPAEATEIALGPDQLERLDATIGDRVSLLGTNDRPRRLAIVGRVLVPDTNDYGFTAGVVLTPDGLERVRQSDGSRQIVLNWRARVDADAATARLREDHPYALSAYSRPGVPIQIGNLARVRQLPWVLSALLALIGLAAMTHYLVTMVRRHRRDLAVLRSLGFTQRQVAATARWQATTVVVMAVVVGLPVGFLVGRWTWAVVAGVLGVAQDVSIPVTSLLLIAPATVVVANIVAAVPARAAGRIAPSTVLRSE